MGCPSSSSQAGNLVPFRSDKQHNSLRPLNRIAYLPTILGLIKSIHKTLLWIFNLTNNIIRYFKNFLFNTLQFQTVTANKSNKS